MNTVLILTGPPAVGKSTVGRLVAERREHCALVDIDDIRHLVISHHAAPWQGDEGVRRAVHLSWEEFRALHVQQGAFTSEDVSLDTTQLNPDDTANAVLVHWNS